MKLNASKKLGTARLLCAAADGEYVKAYLCQDGRVTAKVITETGVAEGGTIYYGDSYAALPGGGAVVRNGGIIVYER